MFCRKRLSRLTDCLLAQGWQVQILLPSNTFPPQNFSFLRCRPGAARAAATAGMGGGGCAAAAMAPDAAVPVWHCWIAQTAARGPRRIIRRRARRALPLRVQVRTTLWHSFRCRHHEMATHHHLTRVCIRRNECCHSCAGMKCRIMYLRRTCNDTCSHLNHKHVLCALLCYQCCPVLS